MATEEYSVGYEAGYQEGWNKAIDSIAQPEQVPVATMKMLHTYGDTTPPQRPWVGLTDEEISQLWISTSPYFNEDDFAKAVGAKLKEKNT